MIYIIFPALCCVVFQLAYCQIHMSQGDTDGWMGMVFSRLAGLVTCGVIRVVFIFLFLQSVPR